MFAAGELPISDSLIYGLLLAYVHSDTLVRRTDGQSCHIGHKLLKF